MRAITLYETDGLVECIDPAIVKGFKADKMFTAMIDDDKFNLIMAGDLELAQGLMRIEFRRIMDGGVKKLN